MVKESVFKFEIYAGFGNVGNVSVIFPYIRLENLEGFVIGRVFAIALVEALLKFRSYESFGGDLYGFCWREWLCWTLYLILFMPDLI